MTYVVDWEVEAPPTLLPEADVPAGDDRWNGLLPSPPGGLCVTTSGAVLVAEPSANRIRWIEPDGITIVGDRAGLHDGPATVARFRHPLGLAAATDGSVIVADSDNHAIRRIDPHGEVRTVAGGIYGQGDGPGDRARFQHPAAVAVGGDGTIVVADLIANRIRRIDPKAQVSTVAGNSYDQGDLELGQPLLRQPEAVALDANGCIYIADTGNDRVCRLDPSGRFTLVAGRRDPGLTPAPAPDLRWPTGLLVLPDGTVYVADAGHNLIHRITPDGDATVVASDPSWRPVALTVLPNGQILAAETHWSPAQAIGRLRTLPMS